MTWTEFNDAMLSDFKLYRRLIGGVWCLWQEPNVCGEFFTWKRKGAWHAKNARLIAVELVGVELKSDKWVEILGVEND